MEQSQSLMLNKLPPELRVIIWDNALDAATLHFECVDSRFQCIWCDEAGLQTCLLEGTRVYFQRREAFNRKRRQVSYSARATARSLISSAYLQDLVRTDRQTGQVN
jgi:hypothetical protein